MVSKLIVVVSVHFHYRKNIGWGIIVSPLSSSVGLKWLYVYNASL